MAKSRVRRANPKPAKQSAADAHAAKKSPTQNKRSAKAARPPAKPHPEFGAGTILDRRWGRLL